MFFLFLIFGLCFEFSIGSISWSRESWTQELKFVLNCDFGDKVLTWVIKILNLDNDI